MNVVLNSVTVSSCYNSGPYSEWTKQQVLPASLETKQGNLTKNRQVQRYF